MESRAGSVLFGFFLGGIIASLIWRWAASEQVEAARIEGRIERGHCSYQLETCRRDLREATP